LTSTPNKLAISTATIGLLKTLGLKNFVSPKQREREEAHRQAIENELVWARREAEAKALEAEKERQKAKQEHERAKVQE
jgi:Tfp pilus assembly protein FimT